MIPQDFIQQLLSRVDIVDVIDKHVKLKKAGQNYSACCPFHNEKTPSFSVSPTKQFYHCFGCGAHGSAIRFLMDYDRLEFPDAIEELAARAGLKVKLNAMPFATYIPKILKFDSSGTCQWATRLSTTAFNQDIAVMDDLLVAAGWTPGGDTVWVDTLAQ